MYAFDFDNRRRILNIRAEGFWSRATVAAFSAEVLARGGWARLRYGEFAVLNDARGMSVQAPDVAAAFEGLMAQSMKHTRLPFATVVASALVKLQVDRVLKAPHTRTFLTLEEANAWLDETWVTRRAA